MVFDCHVILDRLVVFCFKKVNGNLLGLKRAFELSEKILHCHVILDGLVVFCFKKVNGKLQGLKRA